MTSYLVPDGFGHMVARRGQRRPVLEQGHRVGAEAQRRSSDPEEELVDGEATVPPHVPRGPRDRNHLAVHSLAVSVSHRIRCAVDRKPDGPGDGPSQGVEDIDGELEEAAVRQES